MEGQRAGTRDATLEKWANRFEEMKGEVRDKNRRGERREDHQPGRERKESDTVSLVASDYAREHTLIRG